LLGVPEAGVADSPAPKNTFCRINLKPFYAKEKQMKRLLDSLRQTPVTMLAALCLMMLAAMPAFAFTVPAANSILFSVYNLIIVGLINNGVTYIVGVISILAGAFFLMQQKIVVTLFCLIGGILFLASGQIATAFGYIC
jgi:hypothetical protein